MSQTKRRNTARIKPVMSNKRKIKQQRAYQPTNNTPKTTQNTGKPQTGRFSNIAWGSLGAKIGIGAVVLGLIAVVLISQPELRGVPDGTSEVVVAEAVHTNTPISTETAVPAGGPHSGIWANCGYYPNEINAGNALHSVEHGAVWLTYDPTLLTDNGESLKRFTSRNEKVLVSAVPNQGSAYIATAWARQLTIDDVEDIRLGQFVNEFTSASSAPEPGGTCGGGIGNPSF